MRLFSDPSAPIADPWLREAFALAEKGRGHTSPNPLVGCVVVQGERVVGRGHHARAGAPHAEAAALADAGSLAKGAHVAVTLEPCNHEGRTPPCSDALIRAGVSSVTIGMPDPNPSVVGGGADRLRAAGIAVDFAPDPSAFRSQNDAWLSWLEIGRPWIRAKIALTLDGRPALAEGTRSRITGRGGRRVTMRLRDWADAVVVGAGTLAVDDPSLTARDERDELCTDQPTRVVLSRLTLPEASSRVFTDGAAPVVVLISDAAALVDAGSLHDSGADVVAYPNAEGLAGAFDALGREGFVSVLVEPGPGLFAALWDADLIDELVLLSAGGVAGSTAPGIYGWALEHQGSELERRMTPVEAGISSETAVTVWKRTSGPSK